MKERWAIVGRMATPHEGLARLRAAARSGELDAFCAERGIRVLTVFGSTAKENTTPSDLDVAVLFKIDRSGDVVQLINEISDLTGVSEIDVMDLSRADPVAQEQALVKCIPLYEREIGAYAEARAAAICMRMDTDWLRKWDLKLMAEGV